LGSAIDLIERTFVIAFLEKRRLEKKHVGGELPDFELAEDEFNRRGTSFWKNKYKKGNYSGQTRLTQRTI
jgi:hypothetical protein